MAELPKPSFVTNKTNDGFPISQLPFVKVEVPPYLVEYTLKKGTIVMHFFKGAKLEENIHGDGYLVGTQPFPVNFRSVLFNGISACFGKPPQKLAFAEELNSWTAIVSMDGMVPPSTELMQQALETILGG